VTEACIIFLKICLALTLAWNSEFGWWMGNWFERYFSSKNLAQCKRGWNLGKVLCRSWIYISCSLWLIPDRIFAGSDDSFVVSKRTASCYRNELWSHYVAWCVCDISRQRNTNEPPFGQFAWFWNVSLATRLACMSKVCRFGWKYSICVLWPCARQIQRRNARAAFSVCQYEGTFRRGDT